MAKNMIRSRQKLNEGILVTILGLFGLIRVFDSLPDAGPMLTRMLYTLIFIFILITLIGIKIIRDLVKQP